LVVVVVLGGNFGGGDWVLCARGFCGWVVVPGLVVPPPVPVPDFVVVVVVVVDPGLPGIVTTAGGWVTVAPGRCTTVVPGFPTG
jgi:hypothetical protein